MLDLQELASLLEAVEDDLSYSHRSLDKAIDMVYAAIKEQDR